MVSVVGNNLQNTTNNFKLQLQGLVPAGQTIPAGTTLLDNTITTQDLIYTTDTYVVIGTSDLIKQFTLASDMFKPLKKIDRRID